VKKWNNRIYPNVKVCNFDLQGLTKAEALNFLEENLTDRIDEKTILFKFEDKEYKITYEELEIQYNKEDIVDLAINYGKDKSLLEKYKLIKSNHETILNLDLSYNEKKGEEFLNSIAKDINIDKKDATISITEGDIKITKDIIGLRVDYDDIKLKLEDGINIEINNDGIEEFQIVVLRDEPEIKQSDVALVNGKVSKYESYFYNNVDGRITNMKIASKTINGILLMPGEIFSYNDVIGETTPEKGYEKANTYSGNKIVPDYGGGICQVSTALYRAVMRANIKSVERHNHSMIVSYSEPSLDATVANGYLDYKFTNTYNSPIYIEAYVLDDNVTINIYGNLSEKGNKSYDLVSVINKTYDYDVEYEEDNTLPLGEEVVFRNGMKGYESTGYLVTYENGVEVNREKISTDYYAKSNKIIKKGTKKNT